MIFILSGLPVDTCEESIRNGLARYFEIEHIKLDATSTPNAPFATITVSDSYEHVWEIVNRLSGIFHKGRRLHLHIPAYQPISIGQLFKQEPDFDARGEALDL